LELSAKAALADRTEQRAARLLGAAHAMREAIGAPHWPSERAAYDADVDVAREGLGDRAFAAAWAQGWAMSLEQAIAYALEGTGSV
jgi:hypothetical protein